MKYLYSIILKPGYNEGKFILTEEPPVQTRAEVIVTFLPDDKDQQNRVRQKIVLELLE